MNPVRLFGARYSVYTRIALLVLTESDVPHGLEDIDIFRPELVPPDYAMRHPFGKIPALEHDGFHLFETDAIAAYATGLSDAGAALLPAGPRPKARMRQFLRIMDNYAYPACVWGVHVAEHEGLAPNGVDADAEAGAARVLDVLVDHAQAPYLQGAAPTLADLWAVAMIAYLDVVPTGRRLLDARPALRRWLDLMQQRDSVRTTRYPAETIAS